jgi:hypothetical protein
VGYWGTAQGNAQGCVVTADFEGNAVAQYGVATAGQYGLASMRRSGTAKAGEGGVAIAWNHSVEAPGHIVAPFPEPEGRAPDDHHANPDFGLVSVGERGVIIAFIEDGSGRRVPVVGFVGDIGEPGPRVHFGLKAGVVYRVNRRGDFVPAAPAARKRAK